jgi:hypothetical protein
MSIIKLENSVPQVYSLAIATLPPNPHLDARVAGLQG